ncbi:MAG TPA: HEAT repeat domain-containing protein [Ktedonobacteraceae bacterium]|nr:HEAT repeat domain-containing protein [Ktedonobacteraceae bacterium]
MKDPDATNILEDQLSATSAESVPEDVLPPIGITPPQILARDAARGSRGAAWRLLLAISKNEPQAVLAVSSTTDEQLVRNLVECIALGSWAGKSFTLPAQLRSAYARMRLRTLFLPGAGIDTNLALRVLTEVARDARPGMRGTAIYLLGMLGQRESLGILKNALKDPTPAVRMQAIDALGRLGDASAVPVLLQALHGADEHVGGHIFSSLVRLNHAAVPALVQECKTASSPWIRWSCMRALGEIRDRRSLLVLVNGLCDEDHSVAWMAAKCLVSMGRMSVAPVLTLLTAKETTPWLVETASYVLRSVSQREARYRPYLNALLEQMHEVGSRVVTPQVAFKILSELEEAGLVKPEDAHI